MDYISEKINRDPVTGKLYVGKKPGDDQAPDTSGSGVPQPEKKGANFSVGGVNPKTKQGFLGVQPGRDPADTFTGRMANRFIPRMDKETGQKLIQQHQQHQLERQQLELRHKMLKTKQQHLN